MADLGTFILHRFNGDEVYRLETAELVASHESDDVALSLEVRTAKEPVQGLPDTASLHAHPHAEIRIRLTDLDPAKLVGLRFHVPSGYDEEEQDHVATIYYCEHEDLDENEIQVVSREDSTFKVRCSTIPAQRISEALSVEEAEPRGFLDRTFTSQLSLLSDRRFQGGLASAKAPVTFPRLAWGGLSVVALHNGEEALTIPTWLPPRLAQLVAQFRIQPLAADPGRTGEGRCPTPLGP